MNRHILKTTNIVKFSIVLVLLNLLMITHFLAGTTVSEEIHHVLFLNSYGASHDSFVDKYEGLRDVFSNANIIFDMEFLDSKRFKNAENYNKFYNLLAYRMENDEPYGAIIVSDDDALHFVLEHQDTLFNNIPIVFLGINNYELAIEAGENPWITGVVESISIKETIDIAYKLNPEAKQVLGLVDQSISGKANLKMFYDVAVDFPELEFLDIDLGAYTLEDYLKHLKQITKDTIVIYLAAFQDKMGRNLGYMESTALMASTCPVPVYQISDIGIGNGITGGYVVDFHNQGQKAAQMAVDIIEGKPVEDIPVMTESPNLYKFDYTMLESFNLDQSVLPKDVILLNYEPSVIEEHLTIILITLGILIIQIAIIFVLILNIRKRHFVEKHLLLQNEEILSYQSHLEYEANHDNLTDLPNRKLLESFMTNLPESLRASQKKAVVVFIDLDNFKFINNTYGHHFGDEVLIRIGERLKAVNENAFVARIGGDEFVVIQEFSYENQEQVIMEIIIGLNQGINQEMIIFNEGISITSSIGYSIYPDDGTVFSDLIIESDMAMNQAKREGKGTLKKFVQPMRSSLKNDYILISNLKEALESKDFLLYYQPIVHAKDHMIAGFEALLRWDSPEYGLIAPGDFLPLAESSGLIVPIGYFVIREALTFGLRIKNMFNKPFFISINISVVQFYEQNFEEKLLAIIEEIGLDTHYIQLEITESVMIGTYGMMIRKLEYLRKRGIVVALDDFGTGYSSLAYLKELPIDELKIDKSFIDEITEEKDCTLVEATLKLAQSYNLRVVAEGVEKQCQLDYLTSNGCDLIQGYYFSKPLTESGALDYCKNQVKSY